MAGETDVLRIVLPVGVPAGADAGEAETEVGTGVGAAGVLSGLAPVAGLAVFASRAGAACAAGELGREGAVIDDAGAAGTAGADEALDGPLVVVPVPTCVEATASSGAVSAATATLSTVAPRPITAGLRCFLPVAGNRAGILRIGPPDFGPRSRQILQGRELLVNDK